MWRRVKKLRVPVYRRSPVIDDCNVSFMLPGNIELAVDATFHCYFFLESAFNRAFNFKSVEDRKPLAWFINHYLTHSCSIPIDIFINVMNQLLKDYVETDKQISISDYTDPIELSSSIDLLIILAGYCVGGSAEGKKLLDRLIGEIQKRMKKGNTSQNRLLKKTYFILPGTSTLH